MKFKKLMAVALSCTMAASCAAIFAGCGGPKADVVLTFWNPITGPDAEYMQKLIKNFNDDHDGEIYIDSTANPEDTHYTSIDMSFGGKSSPDLALIHKSRISYYEHIGRLAPMDGIIAEAGLKASDYVGDTWSACEIDGSMYAIPYDVLPYVLFYNRKLFPEGKEAEWEAKITSEDFTIADMQEMMREVYVKGSRPDRNIYGMAFNYAATDSMFTSFLTQMGESVVDPADPYHATYNTANGVKAAMAVKEVADTKNAAGQAVCSPSGDDHLVDFKAGRALFTLDGIWSAPGACDSKNARIDTGAVRLPKIDSTVSERSVSCDGHCFATFNTTKYELTPEREKALGIFVKYLIDNSEYWCQGGKVAAREDVTEKESYQALEWGHFSNELALIKSPIITYTYKQIMDPVGEKLSDIIDPSKTPKNWTNTPEEWQNQLNASASASNQLAAGIR